MQSEQVVTLHTGARTRAASYKLHPEINKCLGLHYLAVWLGPLKEIQSALYLSTLLLRVHAPAHALPRPILWMV